MGMSTLTLLVVLLLSITAVLTSLALSHLFGAHRPIRAQRLQRWNQRQVRED
jgi:hypothetical protein